MMTGNAHRVARLASALGVAGVLAAACGGGSSGGTTDKVQPGAGSAGGNGTTITSHRGPLGTYLTDGNGRAVYLFTADGTNASNCSGGCLDVWPPVTTSGKADASGSASAGSLGTLTRGDTTQVTYAGHPLYYFSGDSGAGTTNGEGIDNFGGEWYVVSPKGEEVDQDEGEVEQDGSDSSPSSGSSGYSYSY
jgi:predicted lipoprotein with Yx(FWY)xxD motif